MLVYVLTNPMSDSSPSRYALAINFGLVYLFWGSTYLAIDIGVRHIPPALMCAIRFTIAGVIILGFCVARGRNIRYSARQLVQLAIVGNLLLMGGNLTLSYAEIYIPSGLAALLIAITPLWFLILDSILLGHHRVSTRGVVGLALGFAGTAVLLWPQLNATGAVGRRELLWSIALLGGSLSWALGSVLSKKWQSGPPTFAATAWQVLFAGIGNFVFAVVNRDFGRAQWTASGIGAVAYLVVGGSLIGYTAYIYILESRTHGQGFHVRVCESSSRGISWMAGAARENRHIHSRGQRGRHRLGRSRDGRQRYA